MERIIFGRMNRPWVVWAILFVALLLLILIQWYFRENVEVINHQLENLRYHGTN